MKKIFTFFIITSLFFACSDIKESINFNENSIDQKQEEIKTKVEIKEYYSWVENLRVRAAPNLDSKRQGAKFVDVLDEGEKVTFLGEKSSETFEVKLRGRTMNAPFYKVRTKKGEIGWIFAGALSSFPIDVEHYRVAIFFNNTDEGGDFGYYASEAMNELFVNGIETIFVEDNFDEIEIRNDRGDIIGTENISRMVKEYQIGVVCVEKGRSQKYVDYSMNMGDKVLCTFIPDYYGNECYLFFEEEEDGMYD